MTEGDTVAPSAWTSFDPAEVARFERLGEDWWNPRGAMRALHRLNPVRLAYIRDLAVRSLPAGDAPQTKGQRPLAGLAILDIGCGGGLLTEPLARLGASMTAIDPAPANIEVAKSHAARHGLHIDYRAITAEELAETGSTFDVALAMEVVEHVTDMPAFVALACSFVRPGGLFVAATLNRSLRSFALAIIGAEYVLGWLPKGTHRWERFITPEELAAAAGAAGVRIFDRRGAVYDVLLEAWRLSRDLSVNYMVAGRRQ